MVRDSQKNAMECKEQTYVALLIGDAENVIRCHPMTKTSTVFRIEKMLLYLRR